MFKLRKKKGFSLIELMVAVFILLVAILALISAYLGSLFLSDSSAQLTTAVTDAQYVLEQIRGLPYSCVANNFAGNCYSLPNLNNLPSETITVSSTSAGANIRSVKVTVNWLDKGNLRSYSLGTYITE